MKDATTGEGDIEIVITGLRPGEKLYEELLIDDSSLRNTHHAKILRAKEKMLSQIEVAAMMRDLSGAVQSHSSEKLRRLVAAKVAGYQSPERAAAPAE